MSIHPTAVIEDSVKLGKNISIGAYSVIGGSSEIGDDCVIYNSVSITGNTKIGRGNKIFPFASIGTAPQDLKYNDEPTSLEIGDNNTIREHVTINLGTVTGNNKTVVGSNCLFMVGSHVAHDCIVGNNVILANNATLAGHVVVGDFAIIGGLSAIHQFVRIGEHAMVGGMSGIEADVIPYGNAYGERASLQGLNVVGLRRRNFDRAAVSNLRSAFDELFKSSEGNLKQRVKTLKDSYLSNAEVMQIIDFITDAEDRAICQPKNSK